MSDSGVYEKLINASIRYVSFRPRSEKEFRDFLVRKLKKSKTYAPSLVDRAIERMRELGYVDDEKFALWWIEQRQHFKPKGQRVVSAELGAKGVSRSVIAAIFARESNNLHAITLATRALEKKLPIWHTFPLLVQKKKAYDFLYRRGFDTDTISRVVDALVKKS